MFTPADMFVAPAWWTQDMAHRYEGYLRNGGTMSDTAWLHAVLEQEFRIDL